MKKLYSLTLLALLCSAGFTSKGQSVDLAGSGNSIQTNYNLDVTNGFTIEYLLYINQLQNYNGIVSQGANNMPGPIDVYINSSGNMTVFYGDGGFNQGGNCSETFEAGQWYQIAHTYNPATNSGTIYVNGVVTDTFDGLGALDNAGSPLYIGDRDDGVTNADIQIREFKVWSGEKTPSAACLTGSETDLEVYYKMNEGTGSTCNDLATANGVQNGSILGSFTWSSAHLTGSISASSTNIVEGTNVTFTATALSDNGTPSYQWMKNSVNVGTDSDTYTDNTLVDADVISCEITLGNSCLGTSSTSNEITITTTSPQNASLNLNGNGEYISIATPTGIPSGDNQYTIEAWIYADNHGTNGIVGWGNWGSDNEVNALRLGDNNTLINYWWNSDLIVTVPNLADGNWHHVAATYDGTTRSLYLDGTLVGSDMPDPHNVTVTDNIMIGTTFINEHFLGNLDNVMIWDIARTESEIKKDMNCIYETAIAHLIVNYSFDDNALPEANNDGLTSVTDLSGNNNTGTLNNFLLDGYYSNWAYDSEESYTLPVVNSITGNTSICPGETATLIVDAPNASDIHWISTLTSDTDEWSDQVDVSPSADETYLVTVYNYGCYVSSTVDVTLKPLPDATTTLTSTMISSNEVTAGATYQWIEDCGNTNQDINNETNVDFTPTTVGDYSVEVTLNGCVATSSCVNVTVTTATAAATTTVYIYPNPTSGDFTVEAVQNETQTVQLFDMNGRMVQSQVITGTTTISTSNLIGGVYQIRVIGNDKNSVTKLIISK